MKKIISLFTLVLILFSVLSSCAKDSKSNVPVSEVANKILENVKVKDGLTDGDAMFLEYTLFVSPDLVSDFKIKYSTTNYDEFGVIKAKNSDDAKEVQNVILEQYFPAKDGFMKNYEPDLYTKIENAECLVFGEYVVYFILSNSERTASINDVKELFKS